MEKNTYIKMKSTEIILAFVFILLMLGSVTGAQDISSSDLVKAGVTPDSSVYWLDIFIEKLSLALIFDESEEVKSRLQIAEERLAELMELIDNGELDYINQTQQDYDQMLDTIYILIDKFDGMSQTGDSSSDVLKEAVELELQTTSHIEKAFFIKGVIIGKLSNSDLSEEQVSEVLETLDRIILKASEMKKIISEKIQKIELREKVISHLTDADIAQINVDIPGINDSNETNQTNNTLPDNNSTNSTDNVPPNNNSTNSTNQTNNTLPDNNSTNDTNQMNGTLPDQIKTTLKIKGNIFLSNESRSLIESLLSSFEETQGGVRLKLKIKSFKNSDIALEDKIKGTPSGDQFSLWSELREQVFLDILSSEGKSEIEIKIKHKIKSWDDDELEDESEDGNQSNNESDNNSSSVGSISEGDDDSADSDDNEEDDRDDNDKDDKEKGHDKKENESAKGNDKKVDKDGNDREKGDDKDDGDNDKDKNDKKN